MGTFHVISKETKEQILNRIKNEGVSVPQAAKDAGISNTTIYTWLGKTAQGKENNTEVLRLKRELQGTYELIGKLTTELAGLKKRTAIGNSFMETDAVKAKKITKAEVAKKLGISRSMLYYQHKRPLIDEEVKHQIEAVLAEHKAYGHKRIAPELKLNKKRVLRVMKKFNIKPYRLGSKKPNKKKDKGKAVETETNVYKLLCPIAPNIIWVSDFTYIKFKGRFIYVATVMDMYTREIIGISISRFHNQNLVMEAFMDAEKNTKTHPLYLHSDQGSEYTSDDYKIYVTSKQITISFADKASPWQNGFQESFYGKFKVDLGHMEQFESIGELIEAIYQTVHYYNNRRRHTSLNMSPVKFRKDYYIKKEALERLSKEMGT